MYRKVVNKEQLDALASMAKSIWSEHFRDLFDADTLPKLIESAQSLQAITTQIEDSYQYFFILEGEELGGYFAYRIDEDKRDLFLSKLYLYPSQRRKGLGRKVLLHLEDLCRKSGLQTLSLTVFHKNESAIRAYEKWGFNNVGLVRRDFADDLVFEDYKMIKNLAR